MNKARVTHELKRNIQEIKLKKKSKKQQSIVLDLYIPITIRFAQ